MLALSLATQSLLTEANALCGVVDEVLLNSFFAAVANSVFAEIILAVFGEKVLTGYLLDSGVEIGTVVQFLNAKLIVLVALGTRHVGEPYGLLSGTIYFVQVLVT
jgi:hypothetical protein